MNDFRSRLRKATSQLMISLLVLAQVFVLIPAQVAQAATVAVNDLVINEVHANPSSGNEQVEIYNASAKTFSAADLAGLVVKDAANTTFGDNYATAIAGGLAPGGYLVLIENSSVLNNGGDTVTLFDGAVTLDTFTYASSTAGKSWSRIPNGSISASFVADQDATLGSANRPAPAVPVLSLTPGDQKVTATWASVTHAVSYDLSISPNTAGLALPANTTSTSREFTGLTNGQLYTVTIVAKNEVGSSSEASATATPVAASVPAPSPITTSIVYKEVGSSTASTHFGVTSINAEVTTTPSNALPTSDTPTIILNRPGSDVVIIPLSFDSSAGTWKTQYPFVISKANSPQDGTVTVSLTTTTSNSFSIVSGSSFTVDTKVAQPTVSMNSRCSASQDSFTATTESDVTQLFVYRHSNLELTHLVAVAPVTGGTISEVFIGDNTIRTLYVVAQDSTGNRSNVLTVENDMTAPATPKLQLEAGDEVITASWAEVSGASSYVLRWRPSGTDTWQERTVTSVKHDLSVSNGTEYEVSVASRDTACNQSDFVTLNATSYDPEVAASWGRGGVADYESTILAQALMIAEEKDGEATPKSPYSLEEDKDQNGIKDSEEDKNGNGIKDGDEGQPTTPSEPQAQDRSRLIVTLAILLIIAGTAIAAYSWYQGDGAAESKSSAAPATPEKTETTKKSSEAAAPAEDKKPKKGKSKRKTRW